MLFKTLLVSSALLLSVGAAPVGRQVSNACAAEKAAQAAGKLFQENVDLCLAIFNAQGDGDSALVAELQAQQDAVDNNTQQPEFADPRPIICAPEKANVRLGRNPAEAQEDLDLCLELSNAVTDGNSAEIARLQEEINQKKAAA
ncbi:hypothetical protein DL96DRAFT_814215 [Flagelloscypha sp. PMI_526]|nr:hypothetical protein DL96DRAFT_814215 [Flagelloscypha sp. PMI_526]